ncbi:hypothetical protein O1R50_25680 [Glycomyces luteolus]|uniref:Uncharacterized protein n=1 Tax=Glycomyces luteolus TaxID=2670330 RepID=A0A9X3PGI6_9ACTN|nr:hypothetical protein [Glycomyces luteolus]MDA1363030.1 hypothetical protein [Glycomyces luteolus]
MAQIAVASDSAPGSGDDYGDDSPSPQQVALQRKRKWGEFAAEHGFPYRADLSAAEIAGDQRLAGFFAEMRQLCLPLNEVGGLFEGRWNEVPFVSYAAFNFGGGGSVWPYRFLCAALSRPRPDLVYDQALLRDRPYHLDWYPRLGEYQVVEGPLPPQKPLKAGNGWLGRTSVGRDLVKKVDAFLTPDAARLHTAEPGRDEWLSSWEDAKGAFRFGWAVRGRWLVVFTMEPQYRERETWESELLDTLATVKALVD